MPKISAKFHGVTFNGGVKQRWGRLQLAIFDQYLAISQKRCKIGTQLLWNANRNSYVLYRMVLFPVTISVTSRHCKKMAEHIELVFGTEASLGLSYTLFEGNSCISKISILPSRTLSQTLDLKISQLHIIRLRCCLLRWAVNMINWLRSSVTSLSH